MAVFIVSLSSNVKLHDGEELARPRHHSAWYRVGAHQTTENLQFQIYII